MDGHMKNIIIKYWKRCIITGLLKNIIYYSTTQIYSDSRIVIYPYKKNVGNIHMTCM